MAEDLAIILGAVDLEYYVVDTLDPRLVPCHSSARHRTDTRRVTGFSTGAGYVSIGCARGQRMDFSDGSVRTLRPDLDLNTWRALLLPSDGQAITAEW